MSPDRRRLAERHALEARALAGALVGTCAFKLAAAKQLLATLAAYVEELLAEGNA